MTYANRICKYLHKCNFNTQNRSCAALNVGKNMKYVDLSMSADILIIIFLVWVVEVEIKHKWDIL